MDKSPISSDPEPLSLVSDPDILKESGKNKKKTYYLKITLVN